ncbi:uncharacterized protein LOC112091563 [Morus notabilis]|uniref:uncharacterized protein LOC112091563 n=1 Tax=Morus notabilis TaxID=981085 RepID=UPI000CECF5B9|nr:uncharacterized protein LOC112091563 [Morus notabilis]
MAIVAHFDLELHQMDVRTAFLNGDLNEDVYMSQLVGFEASGKEHLVCKLKKSIYGLKHASRQWYLKFDHIVIVNGFKENAVDQCIYMKVDGSSYIFLVLYVDDILLASNDTDLLFRTKQVLFSHFDMKILAKPLMFWKYKSFETELMAPIVKGDKFSKAQCPQNDKEIDHMKIVLYASVVGNLMYAQAVDDKRSTSGYIFMMVGRVISWKSVKQTLTASSTMERTSREEFKNPPSFLRLSQIADQIPAKLTDVVPLPAAAEAREIEEIRDRLDGLAKQKDILGLKGVKDRPLQILPAPLVDESRVYGRDRDKEYIIELLLSDVLSDEKISVVSIVGMGGIGKITLAQLVYDDNSVRNHFDLKAWVTVSDEYDVLKITKQIIGQTVLKYCENENLTQIQLDLSEALRGKRFLLVLDDVWNQSYDSWDVLKSPFQSGARGSKIIMTTRDDAIAKMMGVKTHYL